MMKTALHPKTGTELRDEWLRTVLDFKNKLKIWVHQEPGWSMDDIETKVVEEPLLGQYTITIHEIHTPEGEVRLEPIARNYPGPGIIELFAWPTLYRVRLIQDDAWGGWRIRTDSGIPLRQQWRRDNFITLVRDLVHADA